MTGERTLLEVHFCAREVLIHPLMELKVQITAERESGVQGKCLPIYFFFGKLLPPASPHLLFSTKFDKDSMHCFLSPNPR